MADQARDNAAARSVQFVSHGVDRVEFQTPTNTMASGRLSGTRTSQGASAAGQVYPVVGGKHARRLCSVSRCDPTGQSSSTPVLAPKLLANQRDDDVDDRNTCRAPGAARGEAQSALLT